MIKVLKEPLNGFYDGVSPPMLLPKGWIVDGKNMRKKSHFGGWKPRKGGTLYNSTPLESGSAIKNLYQYTNPVSDDYHLLVQTNTKLLDLTTLPPNTGNASTDLGITTTSTPGFSAVVGETFFYADGEGKIKVWGGDTPQIIAFFVHADADNDDTPEVYMDYSKEILDQSDATYAILHGDYHSEYYVCTSEIADSLNFTFGSQANVNASVITISNWVSAAWASVSGQVDGTSATGKTLTQDGSITWTRNANEKVRMINGIMGYWYKITFTADLNTGVQLKSLTCNYDMTSLTNKDDGVYSYVAGCRFYDVSSTNYIEYLGKITDETDYTYIEFTDGWATGDFLYIKTTEQATAFGIGVPTTNVNDTSSKIDLIDYWNGTAWASVGTVTDETLNDGATSSFVQTGAVSWAGGDITSKKRTLATDSSPGYWYRISISATSGTDLRIYYLVAKLQPDSDIQANGCVEFKNRLFLWGDYPGRLRFSTAARADCFFGADSGYTDQFGDKSPIKNAVRFYNELMVFKKNSVWLLEGYNRATFGTLRLTDTVGLASPQTVKMIEVGSTVSRTKEPATIVIWQSYDGVYVLDGRKPTKVSAPVDHYFNPEYSTCITAANIESLSAFVDNANHEYHLLLPTVELVYNYVTGEWYPPFEREIVISNGLEIQDENGRKYVYAGTSNGFILRLENGKSDSDISDDLVPINHSLKTRAIGLEQDAGAVGSFTLKRLWLESSGKQTPALCQIDTTIYKNLDTVGELTSNPQILSVGSTDNMAVPKIDINKEHCKCFQFKFEADKNNLEMELWSFMYEVEGRGQFGL